MSPARATLPLNPAGWSTEGASDFEAAKHWRQSRIFTFASAIDFSVPASPTIRISRSDGIFRSMQHLAHCTFVHAFGLKDCLIYDNSEKDEHHFTGYRLFEELWRLWYPRRDTTFDPCDGTLPGGPSRRRGVMEHFFAHALRCRPGQQSIDNLVLFHESLCSYLLKELEKTSDNGGLASHQQPLRLMPTLPLVFLVKQKCSGVDDDQGILILCRDEAIARTLGLDHDDWTPLREESLDSFGWLVWRTSLKRAVLAVLTYEEKRSKCDASLSDFFKKYYAEGAPSLWATYGPVILS